MTENRSVFIHDPKGELYAVTARHRIKNFGKEIILFDPFSVTIQKAFKLDNDEFILKTHSINSFSYFPTNDIRFRDRFITSLTTALAKTEGSSRYGTHFEDTAKIKDRINFYIEDKSLNIDLLSPNLKEGWAILEATGKEETGSIFSTTLRQLRWLSDSNLRVLFQNDTCNLRDFISGKADIFIVLPEDQDKRTK